MESDTFYDLVEGGVYTDAKPIGTPAETGPGRVRPGELPPSLRRPGPGEEPPRPKKPDAWYGDVAKPKSRREMEKLADRLVADAAEIEAARPGLTGKSFVTWVTVDPDFPVLDLSVEARVPYHPVPADRLAALVVGFYTRRSKAGNPRVGALAALYPLGWDESGLELATPVPPAARRLAAARGPGGSLPKAPAWMPAFSDTPTHAAQWWWAALTGLRVLVSCHARGGEAPAPAFPVVRVRSVVETVRDHYEVLGWLPPGILPLPKYQDPDVAVEVPRACVDAQVLGCGRDRLVGNDQWVDCPGTPPWGIAGAPVGDEGGLCPIPLGPAWGRIVLDPARAGSA